ncbi:hypothetical protein [Lutibacter sp.]|uniref:hypothetical protein n=1 Tax=Lutibacter sp. TaxID=1925666 RepID=UPI00356273A8
MDKEIFTRKELYNLVWTLPRTKILEKYAISNAKFQTILNNKNILYPTGGHWLKLKFNKPVNIEKLNADYEGDDMIKLIIREAGKSENYDTSPLSILTKEIENDPKAPVIVPSKLLNPDILTRNTIEEFEYLKKNGRYADFNKLTLPIRYDIADKKRALRIMDAFVKLLRYRGHSLTENINRYIRINIKGIEIYFHLREKTKRIPGKDKWSTSEYIPTGKFVFKIGEYSREKEITDGKNLIETRLAEIVAFSELYAKQELEWKEINRINRIKFEKEEEIRKKFEAKRNNEISKFNDLVNDANLYDKTQKIRNYINAVEKNAIDQNILTIELKNWISWARDKTDWYDPIINKYDELLKDVKK